MSWDHLVPERRSGAFALLEAVNWQLDSLSPSQIEAIRSSFNLDSDLSIADLLMDGVLEPVQYNSRFIGGLFSDIRRRGVQNRHVFINLSRVIKTATPGQRLYLRAELGRLIPDKSVLLSLFSGTPDSVVDVEERCSV